MLKEKKKEFVTELASDLSRSNIVISTNYQGLSAKQMADLRNALTSIGAEYHVVKNTLTRFAADKVSKPQLMDIIEGPVALAFGFDDVVTVSKTLSQYIKVAAVPLQIRGALLGDRILSPEEVADLAKLPAKELLVARLLGQLQAPISGLHNALSFPLQGLLTVLQNRIQSIGE